MVRRADIGSEGPTLSVHRSPRPSALHYTTRGIQQVGLFSRDCDSPPQVPSQIIEQPAGRRRVL